MSDERWRRRRVLVTGATGLLGSWLVRALLDRGAEVVGLVRDHVGQSNLWRLDPERRMVQVHGDITDGRLVERALAEYEVEVVFHLGAQTIVGVAAADPVGTLETNVRGTWLVLDACRRRPTVEHVVVASSDKAYGSHQVLPYDEGFALQGTHPYDVSKSCADLISQTFAVTYDLPVSIVRCGNLFGGGDLNWSRLVPHTMRAAWSGGRPELRSDGTLVRDYIFVRDAAEAYIGLVDAGDRAKGEAWNFSNEVQMTALEMCRAALRASGRSELEPVILGKAVGEIPHQYLSAEKARDHLGWTPRWTVAEGLAETWSWYARFMDEESAAGTSASAGSGGSR